MAVLGQPSDLTGHPPAQRAELAAAISRAANGRVGVTLTEDAVNDILREMLAHIPVREPNHAKITFAWGILPSMLLPGIKDTQITGVLVDPDRRVLTLSVSGHDIPFSATGVVEGTYTVEDSPGPRVVTTLTPA
jgi:hypothetical protein